MKNTLKNTYLSYKDILLESVSSSIDNADKKELTNIADKKAVYRKEELYDYIKNNYSSKRADMLIIFPTEKKNLWIYKKHPSGEDVYIDAISICENPMDDGNKHTITLQWWFPSPDATFAEWGEFDNLPEDDKDKIFNTFL